MVMCSSKKRALACAEPRLRGAVAMLVWVGHAHVTGWPGRVRIERCFRADSSASWPS